ncbi:MAG TPA: oligosaccharide flippase family protein [Terriglobales bacterium]|jgi:O-antigen/teichoic acid export membrane protein|nr:oligosaccharide flippase family protein [Terriglobales bacterium]
MTKINKRQLVTNVGSSWFSLGFDVLVGLFLSPFLLHWLGDTAFGIWVLIFSITGYYGLFDLGIRSSVVRYVSKFTATDDIEDLAKLINTSLFTYSCIGVFSLLVTVFLSFYVDHIFKIPPEFHSTARWLLLMVGASVGIGFPLGVVGGYLDGLQRFYINNWANIAGDVARLMLIILAVRHGRGLLTIAAITVLLPIVLYVIRGIIAYRILPVPFGLKYVDRATFRTMANYSGVTLIIMVATQLKFKTDNLVIGTMISAAAVTYFSIGARIVSYAQQMVMALAQNFLPLASQSEATGNTNRLRKVFLAGNRVCAFTAFPITVTLLILGKSVIEVWVGKKYVATSYSVLVILIIPATLMWAQAASGRVLFGISKHRTWAFVTLGEGIANLVLSIILVRFYGILGDAWGTAIPLTCTMLFFMPQHLCRKLGLRVWTFVRESYTLPFLLSLPLAAVLLLMRRWFVPHNYRQLGVQLFIGGVVYGLGLLWVVMSKRALRVDDSSLPGQSVQQTLAVSPPEEIYQQDV